MIDYITVAIAVGAVLGMGALMQFNTVRTVQVAIKKEQKVEVLAQLIKQLGIKDFKIKDLNAENLDDKGFQRLIVMMQTLYAAQNAAQGPGDPLAEFRRVMAEIQAMQHPGQALPPGAFRDGYASTRSSVKPDQERPKTGQTDPFDDERSVDHDPSRPLAKTMIAELRVGPRLQLQHRRA